LTLNAAPIKVGDLLIGRTVFSVPLFQRSYAWGNEQINDFWEDLINTYRENIKEYFLGSMVFTPHQERGKKKILDGQQRLATILLFLAALRDVLKDSSKEEDQQRAAAINEYIYSTDPVSLDKRIKIELNRDDRQFFESIVIHGLIPEARYESHKQMKNAYERFKDKIRERIKVDKKFAEGILDVILSRLIAIKIEVDNDLNAHIIFETLNDRGLELSIADLLKNYIFSISEEHLEEVFLKWKEMVDNVGDHNVSKFLRHFWSSSRELTRKEELYKKIKSQIKTKESARKFVHELSEESFIYSNLLNPTHEFWGDSECEQLLNELNILRVEQVLILLLALYKRFFKSNKDEFKRLLKKIINFTFRYSTICNLNPNEMERLYSAIARDLRRKKSEIRLIDRLKKLMPDDETFVQSFTEKRIKNARLAKYILIKINDYLLRAKGKREISTATARVNLEHIIPKRPDEEWQKFLRSKKIRLEELDEWKYRLGNMTILLREYNRKIANKFYTKKRSMYEKSDLPINDDLKTYQEFGPEQIIERQRKMAEVAKEIWKI